MSSNVIIVMNFEKGLESMGRLLVAIVHSWSPEVARFRKHCHTLASFWLHDLAEKPLAHDLLLYLICHLLILVLQLSDHTIKSLHHVRKCIVVVVVVIDIAHIICVIHVVNQVSTLASCGDDHGGASTLYYATQWVPMF